MAKAKRTAAKRVKARKLTVKKELVKPSRSLTSQVGRNAIIIYGKAIRGMVVDRSAASVLKRGQ